MTDPTFGIIGGSGMLGSAIAQGVLQSGAIAPERIWISNRSGQAEALEAYPGITVTTDNQALAEACDIILLCVRPAAKADIGIKAADRLILSVMAGVTRAEMSALTGSPRVVRAMSSPAAAQFLAYSPWCASAAVTEDDRAHIRALLAAIGAEDEVTEEDHITLFTALTGPVPGFVAFFAECLISYAEEKGVPPQIADRAMRQLFLSAGQVMAGGPPPSAHVQEMIDYAGTTAAGLNALRASPVSEQIAAGLDAAVAKTRAI